MSRWFLLSLLTLVLFCFGNMAPMGPTPWANSETAQATQIDSQSSVASPLCPDELSPHGAETDNLEESGVGAAGLNAAYPHRAIPDAPRRPTPEPYLHGLRRPPRAA